MGSRGRKSSAELSVVSNESPQLGTIERPEPLDDLSREQREEWLEVVNSHSADRFPRETWPMLAAHCRHVVSQRRIGQLIAELERSEDFDVGEYDRLLKMQERESRCLASLAVRLGFAYSTAYEKRPTKGGKRSKPWEG